MTVDIQCVGCGNALVQYETVNGEFAGILSSRAGFYVKAVSPGVFVGICPCGGETPLQILNDSKLGSNTNSL